MKKVNLWKTLFLSALAVAAFTGCSNDDSDEGGGMPSITVDGAESARVAVGLNGGKTDAVTIESSGDWTITFEGSDVEDCVAVPATGSKGKTSVYFELGTRTAERTITAKVVTYGTIAGLSMPVPASVTITILQNSDGSAELKTNVAEIRALLKAMNPTKDKVAVTSEIAAKTITGIVVSDFAGHNFGNDNNIAVQDASPAKDSGLTLNANQFPDLKLSVGDVVTIPLTAAQVSTYGGVIQLSIDKSITTIETSKTTAPEPIVVTVDQLLDYESMLVKIENCMPATGTAGKAWNNSTNEGNADFTTTDGKAFVVRTGSKAAFKDELIPNKAGYLIGIAGKFNDDLQISPRTAADLAGLNQDAPEAEYTETTIDKLKAGNYKLTGTTIVGVHQKGVMFAQEVSGTVYYVLGFNNGWTTQTSNPYIESVGKLADVQGQCEDFHGQYQFSTFEVTTGNDSSLKLPTPVTFDAAGIEAYTQAPAYKYVKLSGVLHIEKGSSYNTYTITVAGSSVKNITFAYGLDAKFSGVKDGDVVDATGFALGYDSSNSKLNIMLTEIAKNTSTPVVTITTTPTSFSADGGTQDIAFTVANPGSYKTYAKIEGTGFSVPTGEVTSLVKVTAAANDGAAREAKLTIYLASEENGTAVTEASVTLKQSQKPTGGEGAAYEWTFVKDAFSSKGGTITGGTPAMSWTYPAVSYVGWDSNNSAKGVQFGSGSSPAKSFTLSTTAYEGTVTQIVVNASNGSGGDGKLTVKVGGTQIGETVALTTTATNYTFTPASAVSGEITIELTNSAKAMYIKSITINKAE